MRGEPGQHLVAAEISVDDWGILQVQVVEARQDLARPLAHSFELQMPVLLAVLAQVA